MSIAIAEGAICLHTIRFLVSRTHTASKPAGARDESRRAVVDGSSGPKSSDNVCALRRNSRSATRAAPCASSRIASRSAAASARSAAVRLPNNDRTITLRRSAKMPMRVDAFASDMRKSDGAIDGVAERD